MQRWMKAPLFAAAMTIAVGVGATAHAATYFSYLKTSLSYTVNDGGTGNALVLSPGANLLDAYTVTDPGAVANAWVQPASWPALQPLEQVAYSQGGGYGAGITGANLGFEYGAPDPNSSPLTTVDFTLDWTLELWSDGTGNGIDTFGESWAGFWVDALFTEGDELADGSDPAVVSAMGPMSLADVYTAAGFDYLLDSLGYVVVDGATGVLPVGAPTSGQVAFSVDFYGPAIVEVLIDTEAGSDNATVVPEPGTMILLGTGLLGLAGSARRRKQA